MASLYSKTVILTLIRDKKDILFGSLPHPLTNEDRHEAWKEISEKAKSLGILKANKNWEYIRDVTWANWKRRTLEKRDNKRKTGTGGGRKSQYSELDDLVLDIIGRETPLVEGLPVPESMEDDDESDLIHLSAEDSSIVPVSPVASTSTASKTPTNLASKSKAKPKVMWKATPTPANKTTPSSIIAGTSTPPSSKSDSHPTRVREAAKRHYTGIGSEQSLKKAQLQLDLMEIDKRSKAIQLYKLEKKFDLGASKFTEEFHNMVQERGDEVEEQ